MAINYNDQRFTVVENDKKQALNQVDQNYGEMISQSDKYYQAQIDNSKEWAETQKKNQQAQTDFAIEKIEQEKDKAKKDYTKEQSGAYVDWQKQSNPYGAEAEKTASMGLTNSGYSESAQVSMYNTYQNRVATARESYKLAVLNYNNAIKDARLQNNSLLAEIAYKAQQQQLELSLQGFQYKNQLILEKANKRTEVENMYYQRYQDVVNQINTENALAEQQRQYNESLKFQKEQAQKDNAIKQAQLALQREQLAFEKSKYSSSAKKSDTTYQKAAAKLQKAGATTGDGGLMTKSEWSRRKRSGSTRAETSYATYEDYVNNFTAWRLKNPEK